MDLNTFQIGQYYPFIYRLTSIVVAGLHRIAAREGLRNMTGQVSVQSANAPESNAWSDGRDQASSAHVVQFISFAIDQDHYGVDIMAVREIKGWTEITPLPKQPQHVRGVLNLRGVIVPIIDLRCRFGQGLTDASPVHVVIIVQIEDHLVGLLADRVSDIISIEPAKIKQVPKVVQSARLGFLSGIVTIDSSMIALIELKNLLTSGPASDEFSSSGLPDASHAMMAG